MRKPLFVFLLLSGFSLKNSSKFKAKWPPKNQRNMMSLRTQNHTEIDRNSMILAPKKKANLRPKSDFWEVFALDDFLNSIYQRFLTTFNLKMVSRAKRIFKLLRQFWKSTFVFWGHRLFYRFCSQKYRQNAKMRIWLLENPMEFDPNVIESPMPGLPIFPL